MQNQSKAIFLAKTSHMTYSRKSEGIIFALHRNATLKFVYDSACEGHFTESRIKPCQNFI